MKFCELEKEQQEEIRAQSEKKLFKPCLQCGTQDVERFSFVYKKKKGKWSKYPSCCLSCLKEIKKQDRCVQCNKKISEISIYCRKCNRRYYYAEELKRKKDIRELYKSSNTITTAEIARIFDISQGCVQNALDGYLSHHKYRCDEDFLDNDTAFKYYFLGLMATDGHIGRNRGKHKYIALNLNKRDGVLLEDIKKKIDFAKPLYLGKDQCFELCIYSDKLYNILAEWGITEKKSLTLKLLKTVPKQFRYNFLQGVFEGDGSICKKTADITFAISASKIFASQIHTMLLELGHECFLYNNSKNKKNTIYVVKKCGIEGVKILDKMYARAPVFMPRKYERFLVHARPTIDEMFINMASEISWRSTCIRAKVGCVITNKEKTNIVSIGYNGQIAGGPNSCQSILPGQCGCLHAEENALVKNKYKEGVILYCSTQPCPKCARLIIQGGIKRVYYSCDYRKQFAIDLMKKAGIEVIRIPKSRYLWKKELETWNHD